MKIKYALIIFVVFGIFSFFLPPIINPKYSLPLNFHQNLSSYPFCLPLPPYKKQYGDLEYITYSVPRAICLLQIAITQKKPKICEFVVDRECWKDYGKRTDNPFECDYLPEKSTVRFNCFQGFFQTHSRQQWCNKLNLTWQEKTDLQCNDALLIQKFISEGCTSYYDGCNTCNKDKEGFACTLM